VRQPKDNAALERYSRTTSGQKFISPRPPFLFARLFFGFAKKFSEGDGLLLFRVALAPTLPCAGNNKELPNFV